MEDGRTATNRERDPGAPTGPGIEGPPDDDFEAPWWARGRHMQTLWSRLLRRPADVETFRVRWTTPDGDFLDLDLTEGLPASPQLLVIHGLEGSSRRKYVRGLMALASSHGWRGVALNLRSCSGELNRTARLYHAGETQDLDWVIQRLLKRDPSAPVLPVGVSLGGNVLLKWLGERGSAAPDEVRAAVAISTPYDLRASAAVMSRGLGRLYSRHFLRTLKRKALQKARDYPDLLDAKAVRRARNWRQYDETVTAALHGFASAEDYWQRSSSLHFLERIRRPTLLISAEDDPFMPADSLPRRAVEDSEWLTADFTERGGHAGFVGGNLLGRKVYWAEERAVTFLARFVPSVRPALR